MQKQQGYLEGSLEEISSDESDAGLSWLSGGTLHVGESLMIPMVVGVEGDK